MSDQHHDLRLEQMALQAILCHQDGEEVVRALLPEDFTERAYRGIHEASLALLAKGLPVDFATVCTELTGNRWWEDLGGSAWLAGVLAEMLPIKTTDSVTASLRKLTILRQQKALRLEGGTTEENLATIDAAREKMLGLMPARSRTVTSLKSLLAEQDVAGIPTGFNGIDDMTGGLTPGQLVVVGARPGVGKSIFMMNVAMRAAMVEKRVLWVALEMSEREMLKRFLKASDDQVNPDVLDYLESMSIISGSMSVSQIESEVRRGRYELVVVDYLQLVRPEQKYDGEVARLTDLTMRLKQLAMGAKTVLLVASQLNRDSEKHMRQPRISDLRGSGSIEQDADSIIMLHRPKKQVDQNEPVKRELWDAPRPEKPKNDTTVSLEKNRAGREGYVMMRFDSLHLRFIDDSPEPVWVSGNIES